MDGLVVSLEIVARCGGIRLQPLMALLINHCTQHRFAETARVAVDQQQEIIRVEVQLGAGGWVQQLSQNLQFGEVIATTDGAERLIKVGWRQMMRAKTDIECVTSARINSRPSHHAAPNASDTSGADMIALREFAKISNHQLRITLPNDFNYEEVEVLIIPRAPDKTGSAPSSVDDIGRIGLHSQSFAPDEEDYSQW